MSLEGALFKRDFHYKVAFINKCLLRIKFRGRRSERTIQGYKMFIFKMMKDVVKKNICNYTNLLNGTPCREIPTHDEMIADCYVMFDKCVEKFKVSKTNNFYFYFNKSMSRNFYRDYQKELQNSQTELIDAIATMHPQLHDNREPDTMEALMENLNFSEIEMRIIRSRLNGQKTSEFLEENPDVTNGQYSRSLKRMKDMIRYYQEKGEF